jgi:endonuclease III
VVSCILIAGSSRRSVDLVWPEVFARWPTPHWMSLELESHAEKIVRPLGLGSQKAAALVRMSQGWRTLGEDVAAGRRSATELFGCGPYAEESLRLCWRGDLSFVPNDRILYAWKLVLMREEYGPPL